MDSNNKIVDFSQIDINNSSIQPSSPLSTPSDKDSTSDLHNQLQITKSNLLKTQNQLEIITKQLRQEKTSHKIYEDKHHNIVSNLLTQIEDLQNSEKILTEKNLNLQSNLNSTIDEKHKLQNEVKELKTNIIDLERASDSYSKSFSSLSTQNKNFTLEQFTAKNIIYEQMLSKYRSREKKLFHYITSLISEAKSLQKQTKNDVKISLSSLEAEVEQRVLNLSSVYASKLNEYKIKGAYLENKHVATQNESNQYLNKAKFELQEKEQSVKNLTEKYQNEINRLQKQLLEEENQQEHQRRLSISRYKDTASSPMSYNSLKHPKIPTPKDSPINNESVKTFVLNPNNLHEKSPLVLSLPSNENSRGPKERKSLDEVSQNIVDQLQDLYIEKNKRESENKTLLQEKKMLQDLLNQSALDIDGLRKKLSLSDDDILKSQTTCGELVDKIKKLKIQQNENENEIIFLKNNLDKEKQYFETFRKEKVKNYQDIETELKNQIQSIKGSLNSTIDEKNKLQNSYDKIQIEYKHNLGNLEKLSKNNKTSEQMLSKYRSREKKLFHYITSLISEAKFLQKQTKNDVKISLSSLEAEVEQRVLNLSSVYASKLNEYKIKKFLENKHAATQNESNQYLNKAKFELQEKTILDLTEKIKKIENEKVKLQAEIKKLKEEDNKLLKTLNTERKRVVQLNSLCSSKLNEYSNIEKKEKNVGTNVTLTQSESTQTQYLNKKKISSQEKKISELTKKIKKYEVDIETLKNLLQRDKLLKVEIQKLKEENNKLLKALKSKSQNKTLKEEKKYLSTEYDCHEDKHCFKHHGIKCTEKPLLEEIIQLKKEKNKLQQENNNLLSNLNVLKKAKRASDMRVDSKNAENAMLLKQLRSECKDAIINRLNTTDLKSREILEEQNQNILKEKENIEKSLSKKISSLQEQLSNVLQQKLKIEKKYSSLFHSYTELYNLYKKLSNDFLKYKQYTTHFQEQYHNPDLVSKETIIQDHKSSKNTLDPSLIIPIHNEEKHINHSCELCRESINKNNEKKEIDALKAEASEIKSTLQRLQESSKQREIIRNLESELLVLKTSEQEKITKNEQEKITKNEQENAAKKIQSSFRKFSKKKKEKKEQEKIVNEKNTQRNFIKERRAEIISHLRSLRSSAINDLSSTAMNGEMPSEDIPSYISNLDTILSRLTHDD